MDEGKTIKSDPEFHELFKQIANKMHLETENQFQDEAGQTHTITGGLEVKGLLGSDKRRYLLDAMRLSPRDVNFPGEDNNCCVVRLELIENYIMSKFIENASNKMTEYKK